MRIVYTLLLLTLLAACSSNKKTQQARINAAYDARTEAQRNAPTSAQGPATTPAAAPGASTRRDGARGDASSTPVRPDGPAVSTGSVPLSKSGGEWVVTSIKGKFLAIDTSTVRVYMDLTAKTPTGEAVVKPTDFIQHFLVAYVMYPDYNNRERLGYGNVTLTEQSVGRQDDHLTLTFDVKRGKDIANTILLTEITEINTGTKARNDLALRFKSPKLSDRFTLLDAGGKQPQLRNFANVNDKVIIGDVAGTHKTLLGFRYKHEFDAASSPMNTSARPVSKSLTIDSTLTITTGEPFSLPKEGLYYFVEDSTDASGIGLVVADKRFPKMTRPEKLIKPVLYMSTSTEISELNQAQDTKKAFDRYWLSLMAGNEDVARKTLKAYFNRVEEANRLFTSYKEGWKTDKGMIYIVLGAPDRVQRNREREVWVYNRRASVSEINFTFTKKPNQFVEDHYELVRYIEYQPIWYPIVEAWRTGAIRE
ncbi:GWxTD domain-containing protein [Spirosoma utsteinense]|uniref:GWxTD domain-containing protein n=1 Tax=Spirosoma utsteinense TaxID=2585773 RepID=A0ABR6W925_9BACT|nr:GWxTD domain-containing protein [Spirosoma utsteinense]MBC3784157.1 GWxTD domain-containing protein [Spirosoma utsteinense]MBC3792754.1 GWxTD domain-containing protein [Spirosoma utsteinense]